MRALDEFGDLLEVKITARICMVTGLDSLEQLKLAQRWAAEKLAQSDKEVPMKDKLAASEVVVQCAKAWPELAKEMVALSEKSSLKHTVDRPRNLPPTVALQVNVSGNQPPQIAASNGTGQTEPPAEPEQPPV